jgi:hypothetical protein
MMITFYGSRNNPAHDGKQSGRPTPFLVTLIRVGRSSDYLRRGLSEAGSFAELLAVLSSLEGDATVRRDFIKNKLKNRAVRALANIAPDFHPFGAAGLRWARWPGDGNGSRRDHVG